MIARKKKVLFVASDNNATSGAFRSMVHLCNLLQNKFDIEVCVVLPNRGDGAPLLESKRIRHTIIESVDWILPKNASCLRRLKKRAKMRRINRKAEKELRHFVEQEQFDLIHINTSYSYIGAVVANSIKLPFVWHIREFLEEDQSNTIVCKAKGYKLMSTATSVIAISDSIHEKYRGKLDTELIRIYNGIDASVFHDPDKNILEGGQTILICVGTIDDYKGQAIAVEATRKLKEKYGKGIKLWLVGNDKTKYAKGLRAYVDNNGLSETVEFLGRRQDVATLCKQADISCVCSKSEAFGRVTVEAMMAGNLVIGADAAATKEIIEDGVDGLLFESRNPHSLYEKISYAIDNKDEARRLAAQGRQKAIEQFNAERNAEEIYNLYQGIWRKH